MIDWGLRITTHFYFLINKKKYAWMGISKFWMYECFMLLKSLLAYTFAIIFGNLINYINQCQNMYNAQKNF